MQEPASMLPSCRCLLRHALHESSRLVSRIEQLLFGLCRRLLVCPLQVPLPKESLHVQPMALLVDSQMCTIKHSIFQPSLRPFTPVKGHPSAANYLADSKSESKSISRWCCSLRMTIRRLSALHAWLLPRISSNAHMQYLVPSVSILSSILQISVRPAASILKSSFSPFRTTQTLQVCLQAKDYTKSKLALAV